jgi:hypothetical protein
MPYGESDTRAKLIDPAIQSRGRTESFILRQEIAITNIPLTSRS